MPLVNDVPHCINHTHKPMTRNLGYSVVTRASNNDGSYSFHSEQGVVLVVFYCEECGYIENYAAIKNPNW